METLQTLLKTLEESKDVPFQDFLPPEIPIVKRIGDLAETLFITKNGTCHWDNIHNLGYKVFALEKDRFGWLIGALETKKGIITYG